MTGQDIDGKAIAATIRQEVAEAVTELKEVRNRNRNCHRSKIY